ncbi:ABC transporter permease [Fibrella sp. WM1]|uniref:ABC transporter permease n=1 Tax=Fibrella musci TaxID=3242485 RepID=UPI003520EA71
MRELRLPARFELRYQVRQPLFWALFVLVFAQGAAMGVTTFRQLADLRLWANAPVISYIAFASLGPLLVASVALLTGQALLRDRDYRVGTYLYALPLQARTYFLGQFLGTLGVALLLGVGYTLGVLTVPLWVDSPSQSAGASWSFTWLAVPGGFGWLLLPNLLIVTCLSFSLTALLRHITGAYLTLLTLVLTSTLLQLGYAAVVDLDWMQVLDRFGMLAIRQAVEGLPINDKNTLLLTLDVPVLLLINRMLWLGLSGWLLTRAEARLSFPYWLDRGAVFPDLSRRYTQFVYFWKSLKKQPGNAQIAPDPSNFATTGQPIQPASLLVSWQIVARLAWTNARWLLRQPAVLMALLLLVLGILGYANGLGDTPTDTLASGQRLLPFTSRLTFIRLPMHLYISLFLVVFTGELLHRERTAGLWLLTDATPLPAWVGLLGKAGALLLLATGLTAVLFGTGLWLQWHNGQTPIDWSLYAADLLGDGLLRYGQLIALAVLVQSMLPNRFVGHLVLLIGLGGLAYLHSTTAAGPPSNWRWLYTYLPGSALYSDLTGYGGLHSLRTGLALLWSVVGLGLLLLAPRLAQRGEWVGLPRLLTRFRDSLTPTYLTLLSLVGLATVGGIGWVVATADEPVTTALITPYTTTTEQVNVGRQRINVQYHYVHSQNREAIQQAVRRALQQGSRWLGTFPTETLHITETPFTTPTVNPIVGRSGRGQIRLSERDGWMTNTTRLIDAGWLDMAVTKQVLNQWLAACLKPTTQPNGLLTDGLATYLATRIVRQQRGDAWLTAQLAQFDVIYRRGRGQQTDREPTIRNAPAASYVALVKAPLSLTCVGEVWGHEALCQQIGQYHRQHPAGNSAGYVTALHNALPDSLQYAATYLTERPSFSIAVGAIGHYDDRLGVQIVAHKYLDDGLGAMQEQLLNDYVPLALLDNRGQIIHRQLVKPSTAGRDDNVFWLPRPKNAVAVVVDPLGAWSDVNRFDNRKILVRR